MNDSCFSNGLDHSVLLVGYDILSAPPYWIIRNSRGPSWGDNGYMKMAITGGSGTCGINLLPGHIPVMYEGKSKTIFPVLRGIIAILLVLVAGKDPCNYDNYGDTYIKENQLDSTGTMNPCGQFKCTVVGKANSCGCKAPFVSVKNVDGSETCVPGEWPDSLTGH